MGQGAHKRLLERVMKAPSNLFFDITPIGKIFSRFSGDIEVFRGRLFGDFVRMVEWITVPLSIIIFMSTISLFTLPFFFLLLTLILWVGRPYFIMLKKFSRIHHEIHVPVHGYIESCLRGSVIIRAFNKEDQFSKKYINYVDDFTLWLVGRFSCWNWF